MKIVLKNIVASKKCKKAVRTPTGVRSKKFTRKVFSCERSSQENFEVRVPEMTTEEVTNIMTVHNEMIDRVSRKMRFSKVSNGRFFSPQALRTKASNILRMSETTKSDSSDHSEEDRLPMLRNCTSPQ